MAMANNSGDSGHPCRVPLQIGKGSEKLPFILTNAVGAA